MQGKAILLGAVLVISGLASAACSSTSAAARNLPQASSEQIILATAPAFNTTETAKEPTTGASAETDGSGYQSQVVEGGSVTVEVLPVTLRAGSPAEFELSMNTHSVDLSTDLLKSVVLRDDTGKEYAPTKWDGPSGGGHHRSGKIDFPALSTDAKSITLIVKDIAKVPERTFKWDVQP